MKTFRSLLLSNNSLLLFFVLLLLSTKTFAHGDSIFVPTMSIDEPTVGDELDFIFSYAKNNDEDGRKTHSKALSAELSKVIFPHFALSIGSNYQVLRLIEESNRGFDNIEIGAKYEFYNNPCENLVFSLGLVAELGKTGNRRVGAEEHHSLSPVLYFGKGLNNINDEFKYLKPLVFTGLISPTYCTEAKKFEKLELGFTVQYHLCQLMHENDCLNYPGILKYAIPIVEFPLEIGTHDDCKRRITGTINPGLLFSGKYVQVGIEAAIPINRRSGKHIGAMTQIHFFLDEMLGWH